MGRKRARGAHRFARPAPGTGWPATGFESTADGQGAREALARAIELHREGRLAEAERIYRQVLALRPRDPDALHYLGVLCHQRGESQEAVHLIRAAIAAAPGYADAHGNLGNVLKEQALLAEAEVAYRRALELRPDHAPTLTNLGVALRSLGRLDEAIALHRRAIEVAPRFAAARLNLGNALRESGDLVRAIDSLRAAIELDPTSIGAYHALGRALYRAGRSDEASAVFEAWLRQDAGNPVALHMLAASSGRDVPARASDGYVRQVFDGLADGYDEHLRGLGYRVPELATSAVAAAVGAPRGALDILDAGCGTGLCGPGLRPYARRMVGVDLSGAMLARARARAVYDELVDAELTAYLAAQPGGFDLVLIADTLVYFGDLAAVLEATADALRSKGHLIFTVESAEHEGDSPPCGYRINTHGRYSHTEAYLRDQLAHVALTVLSIESVTLRHEVGRPVPGFLVTAES